MWYKAKNKRKYFRRNIGIEVEKLVTAIVRR